ncbi:hypothetical protein KEM52_002176, partial [Ascosphaera acerosa]
RGGEPRYNRVTAFTDVYSDDYDDTDSSSSGSSGSDGNDGADDVGDGESGDSGNGGTSATSTGRGNLDGNNDGDPATARYEAARRDGSTDALWRAVFGSRRRPRAYESLRPVPVGQFLPLTGLDAFVEDLRDPESTETEKLYALTANTADALKAVQDEWFRIEVGVKTSTFQGHKIPLHPRHDDTPPQVREDQKEAALYGYRWDGAQSLVGCQDPFIQGGFRPAAAEARRMQDRAMDKRNVDGFTPVIRDGRAFIPSLRPAKDTKQKSPPTVATHKTVTRAAHNAAVAAAAAAEKAESVQVLGTAKGKEKEDTTGDQQSESNGEAGLGLRRTTRRTRLGSGKPIAGSEMADKPTKTARGKGSAQSVAASDVSDAPVLPRRRGRPPSKRKQQLQDPFDFIYQPSPPPPAFQTPIVMPTLAPTALALQSLATAQDDSQRRDAAEAASILTSLTGSSAAPTPSLPATAPTTYPTVPMTSASAMEEAARANDAAQQLAQLASRPPSVPLEQQQQQQQQVADQQELPAPQHAQPPEPQPKPQRKRQRQRKRGQQSPASAPATDPGALRPTLVNGTSMAQDAKDAASSTAALSTPGLGPTTTAAGSPPARAPTLYTDPLQDPRNQEKIRLSKNPKRTEAMIIHWAKFNQDGRTRNPKRTKAQIEAAKNAVTEAVGAAPADSNVSRSSRKHKAQTAPAAQANAALNAGAADGESKRTVSSRATPQGSPSAAYKRQRRQAAFSPSQQAAGIAADPEFGLVPGLGTPLSPYSQAQALSLPPAQAVYVTAAEATMPASAPLPAHHTVPHGMVPVAVPMAMPLPQHVNPHAHGPPHSTYAQPMALPAPPQGMPQYNNPHQIVPRYGPPLSS